MKPVNPEAYRLIHDGCVALANVEANGMRIDVPYLNRTIARTDRRIEKMSKRLRASKTYKAWRKAYGEKTNLDSREQLAHVLFDVQGHPVTQHTPSGRASADENHLSTVDDQFVRDYLSIAKLKKLSGTFLQGIRKEVVGDVIRPHFNLHIAWTYRSSSDSPNFQNLPIRDPESAKLIRRCFIPRDGNVIVEIDYTGIEVRVAACYHKDPRMLTYITDKTKDMHRDMAAQCYKAKAKQVSKPMRQVAKGDFVFAEFYGDWWPKVAKNLWDDMIKQDLCLADGTPVRKHLKKQGIKGLGLCDPDTAMPGNFDYHIKQVETDFWERRFRVYNEWKNERWDDYLRDGGFNTLTGFRIDRVLRRNQVINAPVQGSAFHCLLWSLIRVDKALRKNKLGAMIVGQVHDSIVLDVPVSQLQDTLGLCQDIMTVKLPKAWPWIIVPLEVEADVTPEGGSWYDKQEMTIA